MGITCGEAIGSVTGAKGVFVWAYGSIGGQVQSANGYAGAVALGDVAVSITAGTDAFALAGGRLDVLLVAGGNVRLSAGEDIGGPSKAHAYYVDSDNDGFLS